MAAPEDPELVRMTPVELLETVRDTDVRLPDGLWSSASEMVFVLDGLRPGFPAPRVLLWLDPADGTVWLLDGGEVLAALRRLADGGDDREPAWLDADTGELVAWSHRPEPEHTLVPLDGRFLRGDPDDLVRDERVTGERAERLRAAVSRLRSAWVLVETVRLPRHELPRLMDQLPPFRPGASLADVLGDAGDGRGSSSGAPGWENTPGRLIGAASSRMGGVRLQPGDLWTALLAAEGADLDRSYQSRIGSSDFDEEGRPAVRAVVQAITVLQRITRFSRYLPDTGTLPVLARFFRLFPTPDRGLSRLIRRWVWRTALSGEDPVAEGALEVLHDDAAESILRLLAARPAPQLVSPGRERLDVFSARGRLVLLGMADLHPRDLLTGGLVDVGSVRPHGVVRNPPSEAADILLHDGLRHGRRLRDILVDPSVRSDLLSTHGIDELAAEALRAGDENTFLSRRADVLDRAVLRFWTAKTEPAAPSRVPLSVLFADAAEHGDDNAGQ